MASVPARRGALLRAELKQHAAHVLQTRARDVLGAWRIVKDFDRHPTVVSRIEQRAEDRRVVGLAHTGSEQVAVVDMKVARDVVMLVDQFRNTSAY